MVTKYPNNFKRGMMLGVIIFSLFTYVAYSLDHYDTVYSAHHEDCAMILKKTHSYISEKDVSNHFDEKHVGDCIRYKDVNDALWRAAKELEYVPGHRDPAMSNNELDRIGRLIVEITRNLAEKFQLTPEEINYGLPTIDTSKTDIWDICPNMYKPTPCTMSRFRTYNGQCSNLKNSVLGMARTAYKRFLQPQYSDGIDGFKVSPVDGEPLPHPREISLNVHPDITMMTAERSILLMSWGQFIGHDVTMADFGRIEETGAEIQCCVPGPKPHPNCRPIRISEKDPFYWRYNSTCMEFQRTLAGLRPGCALGPRVPTNFVTARLDANFLYGNSYDEAINLRALEKGLMRVYPKYEKLGLKPLLPPMVDQPEKNCIGRTRNKFCFLTGDTRANFQPHIAALHHVFVREHNRIAIELGLLNPHWDDERTYQETRHIIIAMIQHICFNELMPLLVGPAYLHAYNLTLQKEGYWHGFDKNLQLGTHLPIQTAAFRWGHTLQPNKYRLYDKYHKVVGTWELFTVISQPFNMWSPGMVDRVIGGFINSPMEAFDRFMSQELTQHLFQTPEMLFGRDLATLNINRGRDHGLPGYNDYREWCGLPRVKSFEELDHVLGNYTSLQFSKLYRHPDDIDLWSAGIAEFPVEGGTVGPTFACIIARQFGRNRKADRYWYENPGFPSSFTPGQLQEIRKITNAKLICENADDLPTIQKWTLLLPDPHTNPRYHCKDLPDLDLQFWTEDPKTHEFVYAK